jgi:methylornithine synthase
MKGSVNAETIIQKSLDGENLAKREIEALLSLKDDRSIDRLFAAASKIKERHFGNRVFFYGFIYFSTHCRNDCSFCFYRRSNADSVRYRKTDEEIIGLATSLEDAGVHLVDLTMGEDPLLHTRYSRLVDLVRMVDDEVAIPIMLSPGVVPQEAFGDLSEAGADWFACYQETHNRKIFRRLRPGQDYNVRLMQKKWAHQSGMLAEEGIMIGVGESLSDRAHSVQTMGELMVDQVRAMSFVPQQNTPMEMNAPSPYIDELLTIAVMRMVHPTKLIPASLDIEGVSGLAPRLAAGANVITSIIPPRRGLAGVAQHELDIDDGGRSVHHIEEVLDATGATKASLTEYTGLVDSWKQGHRAKGMTS